MSERWVMIENQNRGWARIEGTEDEIAAHIDALAAEHGTVLSCARPGVGEEQVHDRSVKPVVVDYAAHRESVSAALGTLGCRSQQSIAYREPLNERNRQIIDLMEREGLLV